MGWFKNALGIFSTLRSFVGGGNAGSAIGKNLGKIGNVSNNMLHASKHLKLNALLLFGPALLGHESPHEKMHQMATGALMFYMTMGMGNGFKQFAWSVGLTMAPHFSSMFRGVLHGYRGALESRSSAAIPFSHTSVAMDQAFATLQYGRSRLNDAYSSVGTEATFFAARYMSRG